MTKVFCFLAAASFALGSMLAVAAEAEEAQAATAVTEQTGANGTVILEITGLEGKEGRVFITVYDSTGAFLAGLQLIGDATMPDSEIAIDPLGGIVLNPRFLGALTIDDMSFDFAADGALLARYQLP